MIATINIVGIYGDPPHAGDVPEELIGKDIMVLVRILLQLLLPAFCSMSLGGLSGRGAKRAVWYGIVGMAIAVIGTIFSPAVTITSSLLPLLLSEQ